MVTNFHRSHMKIETGKVLYQLTTTNENEIKAIASYNTFDDYIYRYSHDLELMQSTGYKDKNGVEIFEGDLVKVSVDNGFDYLFEELSIVKPSKFHSGLVCSLKSHEAEYRIIHAEILGYEYEVVGNIYENPELLVQANEN